MGVLGNTLPLIAGEKAGIIKDGIPLIISETQPEIKTVFEEVASKKKAPIYFADQNYQTESLDFDPKSKHRQFEVVGNKRKQIFQLDLVGDYQKKNLAGILQAVSVLRECGLIIKEKAVRQGLSNITKNTGIKGRWQKLAEDPLIYCDTGHNSEGIKIVLNQIKKIPHKNLFIIFGMSKDKDIEPILKLLPKDAYYVFC